MLSIMLMSALAIVGGSDVDGEHPSVVLVGSPVFCTATILHENWLLTAAHCWDGTDLSVDPTGVPLWSWVLEADRLPDDFNSTIPESADPRGIEIDAVFIYPEYESYGFSPNSIAINPEHSVHDVALIRVATPLTGPALALNDTPVTTDWIGMEARYVGFGSPDRARSGAGVKRQADLPIVAVDEQRFVTYRDGVSLCQGDSGAPGLVEVDDLAVQISLGSFGFTCERSNHARVDPYLDWIQDTMGDDPLTIVSVPAPPPPSPTPIEILPASGCSVSTGPMSTSAGALAALWLLARRRTQR